MYEWSKVEMYSCAAYRKAIITTPFENTINNLKFNIREKDEKIGIQANFILSKTRESISSSIGIELGRKIYPVVEQALIQSKLMKSDDNISMNIPVNMLRFQNPDDIAKILLNKYTQQVMKKIEFGVLKNPSMSGYITVYDFHIPSMTIRIEKPYE